MTTFAQAAAKFCMFAILHHDIHALCARAPLSEEEKELLRKLVKQLNRTHLEVVK